MEEIRGDLLFLYLHRASKVLMSVQSLPKVLEHLKFLLDCLYNIPLSPSIQC